MAANKEPCPRCREQGKDTAGDNLHRYPNGSAFCFSCRYMEKPTNWVPMDGPKKASVCPDDLTSNFHEDNIKWLRQYLNPIEIFDHFHYSPSLRRHVYRTGEYWEARSVNPEVKPKVLSSGQKPFVLFGEGTTIVIVEDVVSAIKVARVATALPLFGSHFPTEWMVRIAKMMPKKVIVWLDLDKALDARAYAAKYNLIQPGIARPLTTTEDPKRYSEEDMIRFFCLEVPQC